MTRLFRPAVVSTGQSTEATASSRSPRIHAEIILILLTAFSLAAVAVFKHLTVQNYAVLDRRFESLTEQCIAPDYAGESVERAFASVQELCIPYAYFDADVGARLDEIARLVASLGGEGDSADSDRTEKLVSLLTALQGVQSEIHVKQRSLSAGYDSLSFFSAVLMAGAFVIIVFKRLGQKAEAERVQAVSDKQRSFSRNLHDGVAQDLAAIKVYLEQGDAEQSAVCADRALKEVRYLIDSASFPLEKPPLELLRDMLSSFQTNYKIKTDVLLTSRLFPLLKTDSQLEILYIMQEALSNIARHADASAVSVKITDVAGSLRIVISDNGRGFGAGNTADTRQHHGLKNIRERVGALGGTVQFIQNGGMTIAITIADIVH